MELGIDWPVDDAGLEARVCVPKGKRGGHVAMSK